MRRRPEDQAGDGQGVRRRSRPPAWALAALFAAPVLFVAAPLAVLWWLDRFVDAPQGPAGRPPVMITIEEGATAREIAALLDREGIVGPAWLVGGVIRWRGQDKDLQPGDYRFDRPSSPRVVLETLRRDSPRVVVVTIPEGLTMFEVAALVARSRVAPEAALLKAFQRADLVRAFDPAAHDLEGYLFPGAYRFSPGLAPERVARALVRQFEKRFLGERRREIAAARRSLREIVTIASMIEKETAVPGERPRIAGVFEERLTRGMRMQCDPTVIYAARIAGRPIDVIRREDLQRDHPYNTYTRSGLPPGPIASPGLEALDAALHPERRGELYFVASGDGGHVFSRTLVEHERAVRRLRAGGSAQRGSSSR